MPRHNVQDTDVEDFRRKLSDFDRRQSQDMDRVSNSRKRTYSQSWEEVQRDEMQFTDDWQDDLCYGRSKKPRFLVPQYGQDIVTLDAITDLPLPSPALPTFNRYTTTDGVMSPLTSVTRQSSFDSERRPSTTGLKIPDAADVVLPTIETEELTMPSATFSRGSASSWGDEPMTPESMHHEYRERKESNTELLDLDMMADEERNLLTALAPEKALQLGLTEHVQSNTHDHRSGDGGNLKIRAGADFEAVFEEFLNVS